MPRNTCSWTKLYKEFRVNNPKLAPDAWHYEPRGAGEITIFMKGGSKIIYNGYSKHITFTEERWGKRPDHLVKFPKNGNSTL